MKLTSILSVLFFPLSLHASPTFETVLRGRRTLHGQLLNACEQVLTTRRYAISSQSSEVRWTGQSFVARIHYAHPDTGDQKIIELRGNTAGRDFEVSAVSVISPSNEYPAQFDEPSEEMMQVNQPRPEGGFMGPVAFTPEGVDLTTPADDSKYPGVVAYTSEDPLSGPVTYVPKNAFPSKGEGEE